VTTSLEVGGKLRALRVGCDTAILSTPAALRSTILRGAAIVIANTSSRSVDIKINVSDSTSIDCLDDHSFPVSGSSSPCELVALAAGSSSRIAMTSKAIGQGVAYDDRLIA
jgi:hypothetical protein